MSDLLTEVILVAAAEVGVREVTRNRSSRIDEYVLAVGLSPAAGHPYCAAFVFWVYAEASSRLGVKNPCVRTASAVRLYTAAPTVCRRGVLEGRPGHIVVWDHGSGKGHTGFVEGIDFSTSELATIEANTDGSGSREGDGVWRRTRKLGDPKLMGFVDYSVMV